MKKILRLLVVFLLISCAGNNSTQHEPVQRWTGYGDSTMSQLAKRWINRFGDTKPFDNQGVSGSVINQINPDSEMLDRVIIMSGVNNLLGRDQTVNDIIQEYATMLSTIKAKKIYCISLSPVNVGEFSDYRNEQIQEINESIKELCGVGYIESWDMYDDDSLVDDCHHAEAYDNRIIDEIIKNDG